MKNSPTQHLHENHSLLNLNSTFFLPQTHFCHKKLVKLYKTGFEWVGAREGKINWVHLNTKTKSLCVETLHLVGA